MIAGDCIDTGGGAGGGDADKGQPRKSIPALRSFVTTSMGRSKATRALLSESPAFRMLMAGSSISMLGSRISGVAFPMLVLSLDESPLIAGFVAFLAIAPSIFFYIPAGIIVDRLDPRRVMLVSESARGACIAFVVGSLAIFGRHVSISLLILAMVLEEILEIFSTLADRRYLSRFMERDNLATRQAYVEVRTHAVVLAGRPVGPFLFGVNWLLPFVADAFSFIFSIGSLLALSRSDEPNEKHPGTPLRQLRQDFKSGFSWLWSDRRAGFTAALMAVTSLVAQALIMIFLAEAHARELSTFAIGLVLAASGAGGAIGSLCAKPLPEWVKSYWLPIQMIAWSVALALLVIARGLSPTWSAITMFILGFTGAIGNIQFGTYLVSRAADDMLAKITSIGQTLTIAACALGPVLGGAVVQRYGAQGGVQKLFYVALLLAACSLILPVLSVGRSLRIVEPRVTLAMGILACMLADRGKVTLRSARIKRRAVGASLDGESRRRGLVSFRTSGAFVWIKNSRPLSTVL